MEQFILNIEIFCKFILPLALMCSVFVAFLLKPMQENVVKTASAFIMCANVVSSIAMLIFFFGRDNVDVLNANLGNWYAFHMVSANFAISYDTISTIFSVVCTVLIATVGNFSGKYLSGDHSFNRFFALYMMFYLGVNLLVLSSALDLVFAGWELLGLSSALLIGFYYRRKEAVFNGIYVFSVYKIGDLFFLAGIFTLHYLFETSYINIIELQSQTISFGWSLFIGACLVIAAAAKSAQLPFLGWMARAMDGPTPSSAIFYGAISVHAGCYMLIRMSSVFEQNQVIRIALIGLGVTTAVVSVFMARVRSDVKTQLAYATLVQVSLIFVEIGFGFYTFALWHIVSHMILRTFQFLTSPALLQHVVKVGLPLRRPQAYWNIESILPRSWQLVLYRAAFHGFYIEESIFWIRKSVIKALQRFEKFDQNFWVRSAESVALPESPIVTAEAKDSVVLMESRMAPIRKQLRH